MKEKLKSIITSALVILPSVLVGVYVLFDETPVHYGYLVTCTVMLLAIFDFATVVFIEQFRRDLGKLTLPALLGTLLVILMFVIMESINRFHDFGYQLMTPLVFIAVLLIYAAVFLEKRIMLKSYLSINSIALLLLWITGTTGRIMMPF